MRSLIKLMPRVAAAVVLVGALAPLAQGQRGLAVPGGRRPAREAGTRVEGERDIERELNLLRSEEYSRAPRRRPEQTLSFAELREDFRRIQVVNIELVQALERGGSLDLKFVAKSASEIKKRAGRLRDNLVLPEIEKDDNYLRAQTWPDASRLKTSLVSLCQLIVGFVYNPVFREAHVVDAELSVKARRDLEGIIAISEQVKKASEKLNKIAQK